MVPNSDDADRPLSLFLEEQSIQREKVVTTLQAPI
jgi:hypothetical protein